MKNRFLGSVIAGKFPLTEQTQIFECEYTITPKDFSELRFLCSGKGAECFIDDVAVQSAD